MIKVKPCEVIFQCVREFSNNFPQQYANHFGAKPQAIWEDDKLFSK